MLKNKLKYLIIFGIVIVFASGGAKLFAAQDENPNPSVPEVHIDKNGNTIIQGLKVVQIANTSFFARTDWDQSFIRWIIKTDTKTVFKKHYGDLMTVHDIKEGDYLTAEGYIQGGTSLAIVATKITDWSDYTAQSQFSGTIKRIDTPTRFLLTKSAGGDIPVILNATTTVYRNKREILPKFMRVGDNISSITGTYNTISTELVADRINISLNPNIFAEQNYQGTLKTLPTNTIPPTFTLTVGAKDYTIVLDTDAVILNNKRQSVTFTRFLVGDTVRVWGHIREDNDEMDTINVSVVRNLNF